MPASIFTYSNLDSRIVAGVMSGTSLDGIDVAIIELLGSAKNPTVSLLGFVTIPYQDSMKQLLHKAVSGTMNAWDCFDLDVDLGRVFAEAILSASAQTGIELNRIDAVGLHGQTIYHNPNRESDGVTVQIGSAAVVARSLKCLVVNDFRAADVAVGGQGAPFVPYCDYLLLHSPERNRIALNIGGIANFTWLRSDATPEELIAFDTGPGNVLVDAAMRVLYGAEYDEHGTMASRGKVHQEWLDELLNDEYYRMKPPKSTGRERYSEEHGRMLARTGVTRGLDPEDVITTLTMLTARTIWDAIERYASSSIDDIIVSGGGARNTTMMNMLQNLCPGVEVISSDHLGLSSDAKEAICFAILADCALHEIPANVPSVTGADRRVVCGRISIG